MRGLDSGIMLALPLVLSRSHLRRILDQGRTRVVAEKQEEILSQITF